MAEKHWIDYLSAIGSIATPLLLLLLTTVDWKYRQSIERKIKLEEKLRDNRVEIYNKILEPFIVLLMNEAAWNADEQNKDKNKNEVATSQMLSLEYRKNSFKLSLIGSDAVVKAFNDLFQHVYSQGESSMGSDNSSIMTMMSLLGRFLLEIRKSMGNEETHLDNWDMLEWFILDARKMRNGKIA